VEGSRGSGLIFQGLPVYAKAGRHVYRHAALGGGRQRAAQLSHQEGHGQYSNLLHIVRLTPAVRAKADRQALPLDMSVSVLTTSHWPVQIVAGSPIALPPILQECTQTFEQYYDSRHSGRRLTWQGNQGTVDMRIRFKARAHEVSCSTQAACVLLCFEELGEGQSLGYYVSTLLLFSAIFSSLPGKRSFGLGL
jgi:hypothetical protein